MAGSRLAEYRLPGGVMPEGVISEHMVSIVLILVLVFLVFAGVRRVGKGYRESNYYKETGKKKRKVERNPGALGEYETSRVLERLKGKKKFVFNAYIPKSSGSGCTETDIIVIHEKGILVVENKNYSGLVYGDAKKPQWIHIVGRRKFFFYNPIYQNDGHIRTLRRYLRDHMGKEYEDLPCESLIVFNDRTKIGRIRHAGKRVMICSSRKVARKLNRKLRKMPVVLSENEMEDIYRKLRAETQVFFWVKAVHKKEVRRKQ